MKNFRRIDLLLPVLFTTCLIDRVWSAGPSLSISPPLPILTFPANKPFAMVCTGHAEDSADKDAFTNMKWLNPRGEIIEDGPHKVRSNGANSLKLSFVNPTVEDTGYYNCTAVYRNTDRLEVSAYVSVYEDISWPRCELEQSIVVEQEGRIQCMPVGDPKPEINWEKDGEPIKSDRFTITAEGIMISNVMKEDEGSYKVEAFVSDTGINRYKEIAVTVLVPPEIIRLEESFQVIEGEHYVIQCSASGYPRPEYMWFDPQRRDLSDVPGYSVNKEDGTLTITKAERYSGGIYTCQAENKAGKVEKNMEISVLVKPVILQFGNVTAKEGKVTSLDCHVEGDPEPVVTIRKDNSPYPIDGNMDNHVELKTSIVSNGKILSMHINSVRRSDDGIYYCAAENDAARVERAGHLEVQFAPNMSATPTTNVKAWASNPANLSCIAEANPNASIQWRHQNEIIQPTDSRYVIYGGTSFSNLLVKIGEMPSQNDAFGIYTCEATNALGVNSIDIRLELATAPGPLSQIVFERVTSTTITFKFMGPSNDGGLPITGFVVKYWKTNGESEMQAATYNWAKGSEYILTNLKPRIEYVIKLAAKNAAGIGDWVQKTYLMPVERVPEMPLFVNEPERKSDYSDRYEIRWIIPDDNGEPIQHFQIRYLKVNKDINGYHETGKAVEVKIEKWDNPVYQLVNLSPNSWYKVQLRAHNKLGNSFPGELIFLTGAGESNQGHISTMDGGILKPPVIIAIAVVAVLIILVLLDIMCYLRFHCGLLYLMRYHNCGSTSSEKVKDVIEDGKERKTFNHAEEKPRANGDSHFENNTRPADLIIDESFKNKSPRGSKGSIGKSSPV